MSATVYKVYTGVLQFSLAAFTLALVWFAFVYYPKVVSDFRAGNFPKRTIIAPAAANVTKFPIETSAYRIVFEKTSNTYYAFIAGDNLDVFVTNRNGARLALKSALSTDNLCGVNLLFVPASQLWVPEDLKINSDC